MTRDRNLDPATERVIASIGDEELAARYPDRTHFIAAENPEQEKLATRALFEGDPVAIVYPDGHELLVRPERAVGVAAMLLALVVFFSRFKLHNAGGVQLPPRVQIEARDSSGHPIAA